MTIRIRLAAALLLTLASLITPAAASARPVYHPSFGKAMGLYPLESETGAQANAGDGIAAVYHGGQTMTTGTVTVHTIFWAPSGYQYGGSPQPGVLGYKALIQQFLTDVSHDSGSQTNDFSVLDQYGDDSGPGTYSIAYSAATDSIDDTDPYPSAADQCSSPNGVATCITDAQVTQEVDHIISTTDPTGRGLHDIWEVILPPNVDECIAQDECGTNAFGGYHSLADVGNGTFIYAVIIDTTIEAPPVQGNDPEGNPDAEQSIDVINHETIEAMTDPEGVGWMDPNGFEVADKCEFGPEEGTPLGYASDGAPYDQMINGHQYEVQDMWSNDPLGCIQTTQDTSDGLPLATVSLDQFSPQVSGNISSDKAGVPVHVSLQRTGAQVAQGSAVTNSSGAWSVTLRGAHGALHATGDDRDLVLISYGAGGPADDLIATGSGGDPYSESGWTGWLDLDTGVQVTVDSLTVGPCFQTGVLNATVNGQAIASPTPECGTASDAATVSTPHLTPASTVTFTSLDNRAASPFAPLGALVGLTVPVGEPGSVSAIGNDFVPFNPSGVPACTAELRLQDAQCSGLVPGDRYTLKSSRGHAVRHAKAGGGGVASFAGFKIAGGDVLTLTNSVGRTLTRLHVAHLRVAIDGSATVLSSGTCQPGDYWGAPLTSIPARLAVEEGGAAGLGTICPGSGKAKGLSDQVIEQVDDLSGGATRTSVPELTGTAPVNDAIVSGAFRALAQTGVPGPSGRVESTGARVSLTITRGHHTVFHSANVAGGQGVAVKRLAAGVYDAKWIVIDANGDTRTVETKFVTQ